MQYFGRCNRIFHYLNSFVNKNVKHIVENDIEMYE
jgi:hypothetical protein